MVWGGDTSTLIKRVTLNSWPVSRMFKFVCSLYGFKAVFSWEFVVLEFLSYRTVLKAVCLSVCMYVCVLTRVIKITTPPVETCNPVWRSGHLSLTISQTFLWTFPHAKFPTEKFPLNKDHGHFVMTFFPLKKFPHRPFRCLDSPWKITPKNAC